MKPWHKRINRIRRDIFNTLTRRLERTRVPVLADAVPIRRVLLIRPNHRLGNQLLVTPLLRELETVLPDAQVDLLVKGGVAPVLFQGYPQVDQIISLPKKPGRAMGSFLKGWMRVRSKRYDLVINAVNHSSSGKIMTHLAQARFRFLGEITDDIRARFSDWPHIGKYPVYNFREFIRRLGYPESLEPVPPLSLRLTGEEIAAGREILHGVAKSDAPVIALYTYATGEKMYSEDWWSKVYEQLKSSYPDHSIIEILPIENCSQLRFRIPSYYSKDLRAIGSVMANTKIFVGADSGMMHLAAASEVPTLGLFKKNTLVTYQPYGRRSMGIIVNETNTGLVLDAVKRLLAR